MDENVYSESQYNPNLFKKEGLGTNIAIIDLDIGLSNKDLQEVNEGINKSGVYVYSESVGKGGPGEFFAPPELIETIIIVIGEILVNIFASFAYDGIKTAIKKSIKKIREKKGNPRVISYDIRHKNTSVLIVVRDGVIDEEVLDLSLRTLLGEVMLREEPTVTANHSQKNQGLG